jgi:hypothetical protein
MRDVRGFASSVLGKRVDYDGSYGAQCVDLMRAWVAEMGFPQPGAVKGAADFWGGYESDRKLSENFQRVPNVCYADFPEPGDIVLWDKSMGGGYGHVAVCLSADTKAIEVLEQDGTADGGRGSVAKITKRGYEGVLGWIHPRTGGREQVAGSR